MVCYRQNDEKLYTALYGQENILYFNEGSGDAVFNRSRMSIFDIDLNNINFDNSFDENDLDTITHVKILALHIKLRKGKELNKELSEIIIACSVASP